MSLTCALARNETLSKHTQFQGNGIFSLLKFFFVKLIVVIDLTWIEKKKKSWNQRLAFKIQSLHYFPWKQQLLFQEISGTVTQCFTRLTSSYSWVTLHCSSHVFWLIWFWADTAPPKFTHQRPHSSFCNALFFRAPSSRSWPRTQILSINNYSALHYIYKLLQQFTVL